MYSTAAAVKPQLQSWLLLLLLLLFPDAAVVAAVFPHW